MIHPTALRISRGLAVVLLLCGFTAAARPAAAQEAAAFIGKLGTQAMQALGPAVPPAQRTAQFRHLFDSDFDLRGAAQFVLGPQAHNLTPPQQQEFQVLFRDYLARAYSEKLAPYAGEPFRVTGSRPSGGETIVTSQVERRNGKPAEIDWHVSNRDGRLLITDVYVDGVSMKVAHRNEFASIIERNGGRADALLAALRQQLAQRAAPPQPQPPVQSGSSLPPAGMR